MELPIEIQNFKFGNSHFIFGTEMGQEVASPEWAGIRWELDQCLVSSARDGKFPMFFREKFGSRKMAFGNADLQKEVLKVVSRTAAIKSFFYKFKQCPSPVQFKIEMGKFLANFKK